MRFARFDPASEAPHLVTGWYDTGLVDYPLLPPEAERLALTDEQWEARNEGYWAVDNGELVPFVHPPAPELPWEVPKLIVVDRLSQAGKLRAARAALRMDAPDADLDDQALLLRDRWNAARVIASDDASVRGLLTAIGADADTILARPDA